MSFKNILMCSQEQKNPGGACANQVLDYAGSKIESNTKSSYCIKQNILDEQYKYLINASKSSFSIGKREMFKMKSVMYVYENLSDFLSCMYGNIYDCNGWEQSSKQTEYDEYDDDDRFGEMI